MQLEHARHEAARISQKFGRTVLFREHSREESYQAFAEDGELNPRCGTLVGIYRDGIEVSEPIQQRLF